MITFMIMLLMLLIFATWLVLNLAVLGLAVAILKARFLRQDKRLHRLAVPWTILGTSPLGVWVFTTDWRSLRDNVIFGVLVVLYIVITAIVWGGHTRYERAYQELSTSTTKVGD